MLGQPLQRQAGVVAGASLGYNRRMDPESRLTINDALKASDKQIKLWHKSYGNPGQVAIMSSLNFNRHYVSARGATLVDDKGDEYLDFLGGYGSLNVGHNHPKVIEALRQVLDDTPKIMQASLSPFAGALMAKLAALAPGDLAHTFLCNSGAEAIEGAVKMARLATGRTKIISTKLGFHGKTMGALSVSGKQAYKEPFAPMLPDCTLVAYDDVRELEEAIKTGDVAAFVVEPVQGEAGVVVPDNGYMKQVEEVCHRHGTLLVADEIQTGLGRTGAMFACEHSGARPDIMALAKSLSGGVVPIGAVMATPDVWSKAFGGMKKALLHSSTFGGNTLACVAAIAALEVILEEDLSANAANLGSSLLEGLNELKDRYPAIKDVRGQGLLIGVEFEALANKSMKLRAEEYSATLATLIAGDLLNNHRIITAFTLNNPNVIRLEPPLTIASGDVNRVLEALDISCRRNRSFTRALVGTIGRTFRQR